MKILTAFVLFFLLGFSISKRLRMDLETAKENASKKEDKGQIYDVFMDWLVAAFYNIQSRNSDDKDPSYDQEAELKNEYDFDSELKDESKEKEETNLKSQLQPKPKDNKKSKQKPKPKPEPEPEPKPEPKPQPEPATVAESTNEQIQVVDREYYKSDLLEEVEEGEETHETIVVDNVVEVIDKNGEEILTFEPIIAEVTDTLNPEEDFTKKETDEDIIDEEDPKDEFI